jgi:hypothetical protein
VKTWLPSLNASAAAVGVALSLALVNPFSKDSAMRVIGADEMAS